MATARTLALGPLPRRRCLPRRARLRAEDRTCCAIALNSLPLKHRHRVNLLARSVRPGIGTRESSAIWGDRCGLGGHDFARLLRNAFQGMAVDSLVGDRIRERGAGNGVILSVELGSDRYPHSVAGFIHNLFANLNALPVRLDVDDLTVWQRRRELGFRQVERPRTGKG